MGSKSQPTSLRALTENEVSLVAGGTQDLDWITVTAHRRFEPASGSHGWSFATAGGAGLLGFGALQGALYELATQDSDGDGIVDLVDEDTREVTVTATPEQISAANAHREAAFAEITVYGTIGAAGLAVAGFKGTGGSWGAAGVGGAGYLAGELDLTDKLVDAFADSKYWEDYYEDGKWDGYIQPYDRYGNPNKNYHQP